MAIPNEEPVNLHVEGECGIDCNCRFAEDSECKCCKDGEGKCCEKCINEEGIELAVQLVGNKITDEDVKLLRLEEKKRQLYDRIRSEDLAPEEKQGLYREYKDTKRKIKDIAYTPVGIFDDAQYGHLRKGGSLNLELLKKWRVENMENIDKLTADELLENLKDILDKKEYSCFIEVLVKGKTQYEAADELDTYQSYVSRIIRKAKKKVKEYYDLDKLVETLKRAGIDEGNNQDPKPKEDNKAIHDAVGEIFESDNPGPKEDDQDPELKEKQLGGPPEKDQDPEPQEEIGEETDSKKGVFVAFDDDLEVDDMEQISELITRIQGVSHISEKSHEVEELKKEVASILDNF